MSVNRIQKLLFSEYCDFEDMVLVESPFAQTTREGRGLRQVHLGLTPSKLILATDILPNAAESSTISFPGVDPDVETLELIAVYPLECVNLSVFHRKKRQSLKARFTNSKVSYFELGGFEKRHMFWNMWNERIKLLVPDVPGSSHSETSVATSTTNSTLYLHSTRKVIGQRGGQQFWFEYGCRKTSMKWENGGLLVEGNESMKYLPPRVKETESNRFKRAENKLKKCTFMSLDDEDDLTKKPSSISEEGHQSNFFVPADNYIVRRKFSQSTTKSQDVFTLYTAIPVRNSETTIMFPEMMENCVRLWEIYGKSLTNGFKKNKHTRRYALAPKPHFLNGLGPWNVNPGERFSIQIKRAHSLVNIRKQPSEPELRLPVSRRQLVNSVSCEALNAEDKLFASNAIKTAPNRPVVFFWTPEYWYRPRSARDAYVELQHHLQKIRSYREHKEQKKSYRNVLFRKRFKRFRIDSDDDDDEDSSETRNKNHRNKSFFNVFGKRDLKNKPVTSLQYLKHILKMEVALSAWDFDSTTLAYQLTLIDRDLFLKIPPIELGILLWEKSSKNAPNIGALIAFSHRLSCLVVTEVLRDDSEQIRARLITRFINTAEKCNRISNFQSCKSILSGLQSPSIYRLQITWNYVRKRHATKYAIFEQLCRQYRDPRLQRYQKAFQHAAQTVPYIPFIGDIICRLLHRIPNYNDIYVGPNPSDTNECEEENLSNENPIVPEPPKKSVLKSLLMKLSFRPREVQNKNQVINDLKPVEPKSSILKRKNILGDYYDSLNRLDEDRSASLVEIIELLDKFQLAAGHYCIKRNELAMEYLLKARYHEERENFLDSLEVEPFTCNFNNNCSYP